MARRGTGWSARFRLRILKWLKLDIARVVTVGIVPRQGRTSRKVDEIGFADLMPSSGHGPGGWSDVAQVEVYGEAVA